MHYVDRGPEPEGLRRIRDAHTPKWVDYYRNGTGPKPSDALWRDFLRDVERAFHDLCAYCEETCKGEVEHFRPKSLFPEHVYDWTNWLLACHDCNHAKLDKWPALGYVDPCGPAENSKPERFFVFDTLTGEILPKPGLSRGEKQMAQNTITDLDLNGFHHLKKRLHWLRHLAYGLSGHNPEDPDHRKLITTAASRQAPLSSIARTLLSEMAFTW